MSWSSFSIRTHVKDLLKDLRGELEKNSYSAVIEHLIELYRKEGETDEP